MNEEIKKKLEQEFTDFLVEKINRTGGSLQFQYLFGCLPQELGFEVRNAFGKTKADVMKFLRGHPKAFKVDQKGIVTLVTSPAVEEVNDDSDESHEDREQSKKKLPPKIDKGEGEIEKLSAKYAIIRATSPVETYVYFTPHEYGVKSDCLFVDLDLEVGCEVLFNAVPGLNEYEIEYRATKVWRKPSEDDFIYSKNDTGKKPIRKNSDYKIEPTAVPKERKNDLSSCSEKDENNIFNEPGKISPYRNGAIIKFGVKYSQHADAKSCRFFLLGCEIFEMIDTEFSEGDDVMFDGIKTEKGWKALLVWSGEKPNVKIHERKHKVHEGQVSKPQVENHGLPDQHKDNEKKSFPLSHKKENNIGMKKNIPPDRPSTNTKRYHGKDQRLKSSEVSRSNQERVPHKRSRNRTRSRSSGFKKDNLCTNKSKDNIQKNIPGYKQKSRFNFNDDDGGYRFSSRESVSDKTFESNQDTSDDDDRANIQASSQKSRRKFLRECGSPDNESNYDSDEEENKMNSSSTESNINKCARIETFHEMEGTIVRLFCKFAIVANPQVPDGLDFVLSAFFLEGKSVEEQNVIDLKEVIKVGDRIKFNYFHIVDDKGDVYDKITAAWIGPRPQIKETTPEEYIKECDLSVSVSCEFDNECKEEAMQEYSNTGSTQSESSPEFFSPSDSPILDDMSEEINDPLEYSSDSKTENNEEDFDDSSSDIHSSSLSEKIIERLRINGCINSKVDIHFVVDDIINTVLNESNVRRSENAAPNQALTRLSNFKTASELQCPTCAKRSSSYKNKITSSVKVQTIITGDVIAAKGGHGCQVFIQNISKK